MRYSAYAILTSVPRPLGQKIQLSSFAGPNAGTDTQDYHANLKQEGRPYHERCVGAGPRPYVPVDPAETFAVGCSAPDQG